MLDKALEQAGLARTDVFLTNAVRGIRAVGSLEAKQWTRRVVSDQLRAALGV